MSALALTSTPLPCVHVHEVPSRRCGPGTAHSLEGQAVQLILCRTCDTRFHDLCQPITVATEEGVTFQVRG